MNLTKLAKLANVSVSTVSKALSDSTEISDITKKRIIKIASENGCYEKYYKPKYAKKLIAVICPELLGVHYGTMATYMENEIRERGGTMVMSVSNFSAAAQSELIEYYTKFAHADGVIVIEPAGKINCNADVPIVCIGFESTPRNVDCVKTEIDDALDDALTFLNDMGHKKIGFAGEECARAEYDVFCEAVARNNITVDSRHTVISSSRFYDAGYFAADSMIKGGDMPTAVFAAYSHIAVGFLQRLKEEKIRVPDDISLICMDDISVVPYPDFDISSIRMHLDELSSIAVDLIYQKIKREHFKTKQTITVTREFFKGKTIGKVK